VRFREPDDGVAPRLPGTPKSPMGLQIIPLMEDWLVQCILIEPEIRIRDDGEIPGVPVMGWHQRLPGIPEDRHPVRTGN
jgi:hypothetical protein